MLTTKRRGASSHGCFRERESRVFSLSLPNGKATFSNAFQEPLLVVAGGRKPAASWLAEIFRSFTTRWCADSGLVYCLEAGILPDRLVGDGDSTPPDEWRRAVEAGVSVTKHPVDKDLTDLQLALFTAGKELPGKPVLVTGCWGGRFDHLWANIFSALWAAEQDIRILVFADEKECLFLLEGEEALEICVSGRENVVVSLLPLTPECAGVDLQNVRWELKDSLLLQKHPYTVSNRTEGNKNISVRLQKGILGVYCGWL